MKRIEPNAKSLAVAAQIRAELAASPFTRTELFTAAGITARTYDRIAKGTKIASVQEVFALSDALGIDFEVLLRRALERAEDDLPGDLDAAGMSTQDVDAVVAARDSLKPAKAAPAKLRRVK